MAGLKQIKLKIRSVKKTRQVTKAMEAVSAVKMRKSQQKALAGRHYARAAAGVLARTAGSGTLKGHPLMQPRTGAGKTLYVVITSDKGLAGALNSGVLRQVAREIAPQDKVIAIGRKAQDFCQKRGIEVLAYYANTDEVTALHVEEMVATAARAYVQESVDAVRVVYQNFISTFEQRPTARTLFPLSLTELERVVADIVPARGAYAAKSTGTSAAPATYSVEPSEDSVLDSIVPKLASVVVYHALLESQASEHSARMVAMKSASDKAGELTHGLTLQFNKARQAAITREVSEIIAGSL